MAINKSMLSIEYKHIDYMQIDFLTDLGIIRGNFDSNVAVWFFFLKFYSFIRPVWNTVQLTNTDRVFILN